VKAPEVRELSFRDFVEEALYDSELGYYGGRRKSPSKTGDYVTSPLISPAFSFAIARLFEEFVGRTGDDSYSFVDVGCADGVLLSSVQKYVRSGPGYEGIHFYGVDRSLRAESFPGLQFLESISHVPDDRAAFLFCNELYDAFPFVRVVMRESELRELWVSESGTDRQWLERPATDGQIAYLARNGVTLETGQFADFSLDWELFHQALTRRFDRSMIVVFDYGYEASRLFSGRVRRYGTAAGYRDQRVHRDLLSAKGESDLTAHVNFTDLMRVAESNAWTTLAFERQAGFLMKVGILEHPDLAPAASEVTDSLASALGRNEAREAARRLILPDGIGEEMRVLVQSKGVPGDGWSFQKSLI